MNFKKVALWIGAPILIVSAGVSVLAARYVPTIRPNTFAGPVAIGGLTPDEAAKKVREWWLTVKSTPLQVQVHGHGIGVPDLTPSKLDTIVDDLATIADAPLDSALESTEHGLGQGESAKTTLEIKFKPAGVNLEKLDAMVLAVSKPQPPRFAWDGSRVYTKPEVTGFRLDVSALPAAVGKAVTAGGPVELPVSEAPRHISDAQLTQITDLVSSYTTHFPSYQGNRNNNIRVASGKLNDIVLLPGERLSFNTTVGRRTVQGGFKEAPVYKHGKHDHGIGGGICQVSSTLYNACLLGDLKIVHRSNHSLPVAYVPLGRDATVDYGSIDLVVENSYSTPIVVLSAYRNGSLTFRILGKRDPDLKVRIERTGQRDFPGPIQYVNDPSLPAGKTKLIEKGSTGHSIYTYRLVFKGGKLVERQPLGRSVYMTMARIVARGPIPTKSAVVGTPPGLTPPAAPASR